MLYSLFMIRIDFSTCFLFKIFMNILKKIDISKKTRCSIIKERKKSKILYSKYNNLMKDNMKNKMLHMERER